MRLVLLTTREHHRFEADGRVFVCLMPSAAMFTLGETAAAVLRLVSARACTRESIVRRLADGDLETSIDDLIRMNVIGEAKAAPNPKPAAEPGDSPAAALTFFGEMLMN